MFVLYHQNSKVIKRFQKSYRKTKFNHWKLYHKLLKLIFFGVPSKHPYPDQMRKRTVLPWVVLTFGNFIFLRKTYLENVTHNDSKCLVAGEMLSARDSPILGTKGRERFRRNTRDGNRTNGSFVGVCDGGPRSYTQR